MPITLIDCTNSYEGEKKNEIAYLCNDIWEMPGQIKYLETWLKENKDKIKSGKYIADIGFSPRGGAAGGGVAISTDVMQHMVNIGMDLYLSEYPSFEDE